MSNRVPEGTRVPDNPFYQSGLSSRDYIRDAVFERVLARCSRSNLEIEQADSRCASIIADVLIASEDAVLTGRSQRTFEDLVNLCRDLVRSTVSQCYVAHGEDRAAQVDAIASIAAAIMNDGLSKMGSNILVDHTAQDLLIRNHDAAAPESTDGRSLWDSLGLARETSVPGQSWNPNGISIFFHQLDFAAFRYWDAIYWRTGYLDRSVGEGSYSFVNAYDARAAQVDDADYERRARVFADHSDRNSLWFLMARQWQMRDQMILAFETTRTRSIETVNLPIKHSLREEYHSRDQQVSMTAHNKLAAWALGRENAIPEIEAILGQPYYELIDLSFVEGSPINATADLNQSVAATVDDIIHEATRVMAVLHVRPYIFWTSETELMIAAARPNTNAGPWSRANVEATAPLLTAVDGVAVGGNNADLLEWSNSRRMAYEPGCVRKDVEIDDARLKNFFSNRPDLERLLNSESWSEDDIVLIHRLVRLGRFGYGLPQVRKPEYWDVHVLP